MSNSPLGVRVLLLVLLLATGRWLAPLHGQAGGNPTGLTGQVSGTTVTLSWLAPAAPPAPVVGYAVQAGTAPGTPVVSVPVGNIRVYSVSAPVGTYYVRVVALAASGPIGVSNEIQIVVQPIGVPAAPLSLEATVTGMNVTLRWQANPAGPAPTFYQLQAGSAPGRSDLAVLSRPAFSFTYSTLAPAGTYYIRVAAGNAGGIGPPSNEVSMTIVFSCVPTMMFPPLATVVPAAVSLRWTPRPGPSPAGYRLFAGTVSGQTDLGVFDFPAGTLVVGTPAPSRRYFVRIAAFNACGLSAPSDERSFVVPPTNLPSLIGTWRGTLTNHVPRSSLGRVMTSFTLQLLTNPPFSGSTHGGWTSAGCNHSLMVGSYDPGTGAPEVSLESFSCNDGDFGLLFETLSPTMAAGPCIGGGPNCRFTMTKP
jgi:hypothetical protein